MTTQDATRGATEETTQDTTPNSNFKSKTQRETSNNNGTAQVEEEKAPKRTGPSAMLAKIGLDAGTAMLMFKGSLPPIIGIAMYQSTDISDLFTTLGYEIPIITILAMAILPRGKYIQTLALNILAICAGSALALLVLWSSIQARAHTSQPSPPTLARPPYNSSQSAVLAIWLFFNIWLINLMRAKFPSFNLPSIIFSILVNIAATYGVFMTTTAQAEAFIRQLMTSMLLALGLTTGVSLFVFPMSSRRVVMRQFVGVLGLLRKGVALERDYLQGLEKQDMFTLEPVETAVGRDSEGARQRRKRRREEKRGQEAEPLTNEAKSAKALREVITQLKELAGKMHVEIAFAKRDTAWGKLDAHDLGDIFKHLRKILVPVVGLSTIMDIFRRAAEHRGWNIGEDATAEEATEKEGERRIWNEVMKQLHEPFCILSEAIDQGLEHAGLQLELLPRPKTATKGAQESDPDVEERGSQLRPGETGFAKIIDKKVKKFYNTRNETLGVWARETGLMGSSAPDSGASDPLSGSKRERRQAQLYVLLYMEQLMHAAGEAVQDLVDFADKKVEDGTMKKKRLLVPTLRRLRKWLASIFNNENLAAVDSSDMLERGPNVVYMGDAFGQKKDPEHLPATNAWQRFGNGLRAVSKLLSSQESLFGLRCACATMTVGIVCYLEETQVFFQTQRFVWAMIIIAIGMTQTAGQSIFGFFCRVGGSLIAMICSYIIWYIVDEKTPGVIVFLWIFVFIGYYFFIKFPRFIPAVMIAIITQVLIIGYELQVRQIGVATSERSGQPYYATYQLAPYRLATVTSGCLVAFIWTVFPSPLTDRTWMRRDLSASLYLLANYFSVINETLKAAMREKMVNMDVPGTPANRLFKVRQKLFGKLMLLLPSLETHSHWQKWEPNIGGRFPREAYDDIVLRTSRILNYLTLISYTVTWSPRDQEPSSDPMWLQALGDLITQIGPTHYTILSTLTLLSNSLLSGQSLPPYIPLPRPWELTHQLLNLQNPYQESEWQKTNKQEINTMTGLVTASRVPSASGLNNILDARNMDQRGYTAFAVLQVCSMLICDDLEGLIQAVSGLVGVVDFSFRVEPSGDSLDGGNSKGKGKED